jgi:hypothetical protein
VFDDGPKTGPGLEPPNTVGTPGSAMNPGVPLAGAGAFGNPIGGAAAGTGSGPIMMGPGTPGGAGMGAAAGGSGAAIPPADPGSSAGGAGGAGAAGAAGGGSGSGGLSSDPDAGTCEVERLPALGVDQRIIAPDGGQRPIARACEYELPESATQYLPDHVNLEHTREGQRTSVPRVEGAASCDLLNGGFYYDDPQSPTRLIACPSTCARILQGGVIEIVLGCPTVTR